MHIAFVTFGNFDGHATLKRATGMAEPLIRAGHRVSLLLEECSANKEKAFIDCPEAEIHWHQRSKGRLEERRAKQATLRRLDPDVVWICGVGIRNWVWKTSPKQLILADHSELLSSIQTQTLLRRSWEFSFELAHLVCFGGHICASRYLEKLYARRLMLLGRSHQVHYSPYAFANELVAAPRTVLSALRETYKGKKIIVYMGSFWENYGIWDMLHVCKELYGERDDFCALFMGRGPEKESAVKWLDNHSLTDRIQILGYVPEGELSSYFELADAFICPLRDTIQDRARCPSKLFMYLPFKKPIITCQIGEAKELFKEDGFYYGQGSRSSLKIALLELLEGTKAFSPLSEAEHSWDRRTQVFLKWLADTYGRT